MRDAGFEGGSVSVREAECEGGWLTQCSITCSSMSHREGISGSLSHHFMHHSLEVVGVTPILQCNVTVST